MFTRVIIRAAIALALAVTVIGVGAPAARAASAPEYWADYFHTSGGATRLVVRAEGEIVWYNRSVGLPTAWLWVRAGYCGRAKFEGYAGNITSPVDVNYSSILCLDASGWYEVGPVFGGLDGSNYSGGITYIKVYAQKVADFDTVLGQGTAYRFNR
jgi:hypothetical protein